MARGNLTRPTQRNLAKALEISQPMVSKLAKQGMPLDSVEAAREWRRRHLDNHLTVDYRLQTQPCGPRRKAPPDPVAAVNQLGSLAVDDFATHGEPLRKAIGALTRAQYERVELDV